MACYHPLQAYRSQEGRNPLTGKWPITFDIYKGYSDLPMTIPCGQCIGCRLEKSRQWAIRCVHEATLYKNNSWITLTYNNESLKSNSLNKRDYQLFMKRLRKRFGNNIRYFQCGEYGELEKRPHYHAILFNHDFDDKQFFKKTPTGYPLYTSKELQKLWPYGYSAIGGVTFETTAYTARYALKKVTGVPAENHYNGRLPEYITMSRRPGIAREWYNQFKTDVYPHDYLVIRDGLKCKPPKYYDNLFDIQYPDQMQKIKSKRKKQLDQHSENNTPERLEIREYIQYLKADKLKRPLEKGDD